MTSSLLVVLTLSLIVSGPFAAQAATTPALGAATGYAILGSTYTNISTTSVSGSVGFSTGPLVAPTGTHANYGSGAPYTQAGIDQAAALNVLNAQTCDFTFASTTDLSLLAQPLVPGVYCIAGAQSIGTGGITLNGAGTYIFRSTGALTTANGSVVTLTGGASVCDIFWTPIGATTLGSDTIFKGTVIQPNSSAITVGSNTVWTGAALAFGGTVTTDTDTIALPTTCTYLPGTLHVIKTVANAGGGTALASDFMLHVKLAGVDVSGSPAAGTSSGTLYSLPSGTYAVSEVSSPAYSQSFSGDCDATGNVTLYSGSDSICTMTNTYLPPPAPVVVRRNGGGISFFTAPSSVVSVPVATTATVTPVTTVSPTLPTVVVPSTTIVTTPTPIPTFPNTGLPPKKDTSSSEGIIVFFGLAVISVISYVGFKKFRI
jgi:hypothetical protein